MMKNLDAEFIIGATKVSQFPQLNKPEVAFTGRSNVGKSSLLNSIVLRKNLAKTSATPGKTQQINFYDIENKWIFTDLPGFGYAEVPKTLKESWIKLVFEYFQIRENLRLVCLLVDSRHDPTKIDISLMEWFENNNKKFLVILTKCDKISQKLIEERKKQVEHLLQFCKNNIEVLPYSSKTNMGRNELLAIIKKITV
ncbi:MAG: ribosome biogenesis GTP-binding protein YihA/YsxC [Candidatus Kapabacteria bacterium]|nr:ribosome biogenesis GTP-binding protein YihA/YsxC [Candidatus Kapabacteria bacterium]